MFGDYLFNLMQPWRRVSRSEFVIALTLLSVPSMLFAFTGMMNVGNSWLGSVADLPALIGQAQSGAQNGDLQALQALASKAGAGGAAASEPLPAYTTPFDVGGFFGGLCLLLAAPFVRGRWLDMGYGLRTAAVLTVLMQLSVINNMLGALALGSGPLPFAWAFGAFTGMGYLWLSMRASPPRRPVHERLLDGQTHIRQASRDDDDYPRPQF